MKTNITLIENYERSSWDVTMDNLKKLELTIDDIAGLFYQNNDEYKRMANDLLNATDSHNDIVTNICLAKTFHQRLSGMLQKSIPIEMFTLLLKLAGDLPFYSEVLLTKYPEIPLDLLKKNFEALYHFGSCRLPIKDISLTSKFDLWKFAHMINMTYKSELYVINLELVERSFDYSYSAPCAEFCLLKENYIKQLAQKKETDKEILQEIEKGGSHCCS